MSTSLPRRRVDEAHVTATTAATASATTSTLTSKPRQRNAIGLTNMQMRALTIATLVPIMFVLGLQSKMHVAVMVWLGMFGASMEWSGVKRHLKVELLLCNGTIVASHVTGSNDGDAGDDATQRSATTTTLLASPPLSSDAAATAATATVVALGDHPREYARPVPPLTLYTIVKHIAWACLAFAAYYGEAAFGAVMALYFVVFVTLTLTVHNRLEERVQQAVVLLRSHLSSRARTAAATAAATTTVVHKKTDSDNQAATTAAAAEAAAAASWRSLWQHFRAMELFVVAQRQPTEQFLDFCLDIFGIVWLSGLVPPVLLYSLPSVGVPWVYSATISNFANDICALLVGRAVTRAYRAQQDVQQATAASARDGSGGVVAAAGAASTRTTMTGTLWQRLWQQCLLHGQQPLYKAISPNKSVGGAVAGVLGSAVTFTLCMYVAYACLPPPAADVIAPQFQCVLLWLVVGAAMGVMGVIGDLAQSLLKRSAHVKDTGFIIPGHGGMLDRVDGLLIVYPFMYGTVSLLRALSYTS